MGMDFQRETPLKVYIESTCHGSTDQTRKRIIQAMNDTRLVYILKEYDLKFIGCSRVQDKSGID